MLKAASRPANRAALIAFALPCVFASIACADELPEVTVTADRIEEPIGQTGASVTIIPHAEIEKLGAKGLADVLRGVAGLDVTQTGGVGSATEVRLRGSNPGETLVLIDGVRVGNPSSTDGSVDFGNLSAVDIERVEVLRGPQSALYGSDAMGGVINIITRKGGKTPHRSVTIEAGSYGTVSTRATMSGGDDRWTYSLGVDALHADGFPRWGYRVDQPLSQLLPFTSPPLPLLPADDPTNKGGASGRFSYRLSDDVSIDAGFSLFGNALRFDNPYASLPGDVFSHYNFSRTTIADGFVRANVDSFGGLLHSQLTVFSNATNSNVWETEACYDDVTFAVFNCRSGYQGARFGAEYQGDLKLGAFGGLTLGARTETETASTSQSPDPADGSFAPIRARQTTNSVFAEHRVTLGDRLDLTLGGRIDAVELGQTFATWRATAAYRIDETGTKLRASVGTGDKAATLYQRFSQYGDPTLAPEQSFGFDAGIDQKLFNGRLVASATVFDTSYRNLIDFANGPGPGSPCAATQINGCYYNVGRAETKGVELSGDAVLVPDVWRARASYTYLDARDLDAGTQLLQRPRDKGALSLIYDGIAKLELESRLTLVGSRLDFGLTTPSVTLAPYAKLDFLANYKFNDSFAMFGRVENVTDARYEEVYDYGTAGRSYYAGISYSW
ncbi:MAG: TonB-dependent receptor [Roseiarcus sp.]|jgi:vitamin B12 transporter